MLCVTSFLNVLQRDDVLYCTFNCNEMVFSVEDPEPEDGDLDADPDGGVQATHLAVVKVAADAWAKRCADRLAQLKAKPFICITLINSKKS